MKYSIVWNADKTLGIITSDHQLAYEARKGADTNCVLERADGYTYQSKTAIGFCEDTVDEDCTIQVINVLRTPEKAALHMHPDLIDGERN